MTDNVESHTVALLREIRADIAGLREEMREGFTRLETHVTASDDENAKALEQILQHTASINEVLIDLQARVVRNEKRVKALEGVRPEA